MHLKEERMLTQAALNDVILGSKEVFEHTVGHLRAAVSYKLTQSGIDPTSVDCLSFFMKHAILLLG